MAVVTTRKPQRLWNASGAFGRAWHFGCIDDYWENWWIWEEVTVRVKKELWEKEPWMRQWGLNYSVRVASLRRSNNWSRSPTLYRAGCISCEFLVLNNKDEITI